MKKLIYTLLLLIALPLVWSCEKDEEEEKKGTVIPEGWTKNDDLLILDKHPWYLYRSGIDSIIIEFYQFKSAYDYGGMRYYSYKKNNQGNYTRVNFSYLHEAYSIEKNGRKEIFGQGYELKNYGTRYELIDNKTVLIYNLPEMQPFVKGLEFKAVSEEKYNDKNLLKGGWYHSEVVDSTVLVFEDNNLKEYLFVRGSSTISDFWEYGDYTATSTETYLQDEFLGRTRDLKLKEFSSDNCTYKINGDDLSIYWKSPRETTVYKRIKR